MRGDWDSTRVSSSCVSGRSPRRERAKRAVAERCRFEPPCAGKSRVIGVVICVI